MRVSKLWLVTPIVALSLCSQGADFQRSAIPGWKLALQTYTFNNLTVLEAIDQAKDAGIQYVEFFPGQKVGGGNEEGMGPDMSPEATKLVRDKLAENNMHAVAFGVTGVAEDEAGVRKLFSWAQSWGIRNINTEVGKAQFPLMDRLAEEYGIKIGIHNHPKPSHYWDPAFTASETAGFANIGACADTGHWPRSGIVPMDGIKILDGKIVGLHFKDVVPVGNGQWQDRPWGSGDGNAKAMLEELYRQGFKGPFSIEYEVFDDQRPANIKKCADWWYQAVAEIAAAHAKPGAGDGVASPVQT